MVPAPAVVNMLAPFQLEAIGTRISGCWYTLVHVSEQILEEIAELQYSAVQGQTKLSELEYGASRSPMLAFMPDNAHLRHEGADRVEPCRCSWCSQIREIFRQPAQNDVPAPSRSKMGVVDGDTVLVFYENTIHIRPNCCRVWWSNK